jgi:hypothetical protein
MYDVPAILVEQRPDRFFPSTLFSDIIIVASNEKWGHVSAPRNRTEIEQPGIRLSVLHFEEEVLRLRLSSCFSIALPSLG